MDAMRRVKGPIVLIDRDIDTAACSAVQNDHKRGMTDAVTHLLELGHRRIALIGGSRDTLPGREREVALRAAVEHSASGVAVQVMEGTFSTEHGARATTALLDRDDAPTAIVCGGNQLLVGCLQVLNEREVRIGSEISLVTCDDTATSMVYRPPIASISRDTVGLGRTAAELLLRRLQNGAGPESVVLPTRFTARASCAPPPA
jgi:LacI family transcriptional regulator